MYKKTIRCMFVSYFLEVFSWFSDVKCVNVAL